MKLSLRTDFREVKAKLARLPDDLRDRAISMSLNRTGDKGRAEANRAIAETYAIPAREVGAQVSVRRASRNSLVVEIEAFPVRRGHRSRNVMLFSARQTKQGVTVRIRRDGGRKLIKGAFIANKGRTVFIREPYPLTKRLPIRGVDTIDVPQMFNSRPIMRRVLERVRAECPKEFDRAAAYLLDRFNKT